MANEKEMDMHRQLKPMSWYLVPIGLSATLFMSGPFGMHTKINKINCKDLKPPYIILSNHASMIDFPNVLKAVFPRRVCWVCSIEEFNRGEWLMRHAGCVPKRKYTKDVSLMRRIKTALNKDHRIIVVHPEARFSIGGVPDSYSEAIGKFVKFCDVPVVVFNQKGNYLYSPQWAKKPNRKEIKQEADFIQVVNQEDVRNLSEDEIQKKIEEAFDYDDFKYQADHKIKLTFKDRAKGIHRILYKCPCCGDEKNMTSYENFVECKACGAKWEMDEYSRLHLINDDKKWDASLAHVPNWYHWERDKVREEIENGNYLFEDDVRIEHLVNPQVKFRTIGTIKMRQDLDGIKLFGKLDDGTDFLFEKPASSTSAIHIEYNFLKRGDAIEVSDLTKTYFVYPLNEKNILTKIHFATEILYQRTKNK